MSILETHICRRCRIDRPVDEFDRHKNCEDGRRKICKHCRNDDRRSRYAKDEIVRQKGKAATRKHRLQSRYGISEEQYEEMYNRQNGLCAICKKTCPKYGETLSVDHCHTTEKVRGLLCDPCNRLLACARDSKEILTNAIEYLESY